MRRGDNIRKRADGRYEARYPKGRTPEGRLLYGCCYGRTYEEAAEKREEVLRRETRVRELNLLILGAGSHGREVRELAQRLNVFRRIAFLDDGPAKAGVLGPCAALERWVGEYPVAIPAVGNRTLRMRWLGELARAGFVLPVLVHPDATVSPSAALGYGTVVCARAAVGSGAVIGTGCIIASAATIERNAVLPDGAHVDCGQVVRCIPAEARAAAGRVPGGNKRAGGAERSPFDG